MYMHIASHGDSVQMAKVIHDALALTKTPGPDATPAAQSATDLGFDQKQVEQILGPRGEGQRWNSSDRRSEGRSNYRFRHDGSAVDGSSDRPELPADRQWKAAITGDFVLLGSEVNPGHQGATKQRNCGNRVT